MKTLHILFLMMISAVGLTYAEDVALHDGETYLGCKNIGNTNIFLNDPNDYASIKPGFIYLPNGCSSLPQVAPKYLKQVGGAIVEMSQAKKDAIDVLEANTQAAALLSGSRSGAKDSVDQLSSEGVRLRASLLVVMEEMNALRQWLESFKAEVALASNLADLKTRVATLPATPGRNATQLKTAIKTKIDNGSAD